ncbi:hypothetical protein BWQ96_04223 [Gracilariopsis chorda]|uniref:MOSC domain-containing protein n=1 Tax=Gracilariopsis chorda TaxID=448386 RepID=A0A2V3IV78_9FLOR|nr:hypothetical protein BWQ96_04223 [Gracilariopsis chorda]|eukprot:PXF46048.1 hypothetical protein BWQ96_04223 [Gracilariopsis chorda]
MSTTTVQQSSAAAVMKRTKDCTNVHAVVPFLPFSTLSKKLLGPKPIESPRDNGCVSLIVERPDINLRNIVNSTRLTVGGGMENSGWVERPEVGKKDQICVMSEAVIRAITNGDDKDEWAAAGDNLFVDLDLGKHNLKVGDRVQVGDRVLLEVSSKPHTGCIKFSTRFGQDALKAVSVPLAKERRLRGIYFFVVKGGEIKAGDKIKKLKPELESEAGKETDASQQEES